MTTKIPGKAPAQQHVTCRTCGGLQYVTKPGPEYATASVCQCVGECTACNGQGYVLADNAQGYTYAKPCSCQGLQTRVRRFNQVRLPARYHACTLENYLERDNNNLINLKYELLRYRQQFVIGTTGLVLSGPPGTGKTHLLCGLLGQFAVEQGIQARFIDFGDLTTRIRQGYADNKSDNEIIDDLVEIPVLGLDELGKGKGSDWEISVLDALVNRRYNSGKTTLFTTNYALNSPGQSKGPTSDQVQEKLSQANQGDLRQTEQLLRKLGTPTLEERVGPRIYSRLNEMCFLRTLKASDMRQVRQKSMARPVD